MKLSTLTVIEELVDKIWWAINVLPWMHRIKPKENKWVESLNIEYIHL